MKHSTIKAKPHLNGDLNHRQTLEHIFWVKLCKLSYTQTIDLKKWAYNTEKRIKWE